MRRAQAGIIGRHRIKSLRRHLALARLSWPLFRPFCSVLIAKTFWMLPWARCPHLQTQNFSHFRWNLLNLDSLKVRDLLLQKSSEIPFSEIERNVFSQMLPECKENVGKYQDHDWDKCHPLGHASDDLCHLLWVDVTISEVLCYRAHDQRNRGQEEPCDDGRQCPDP